MNVMKALVFKSPGKIELEEIAQPKPARGESLINVRAVGICGSDFEGFLGKTGRRIPPLVMGHEMAGAVEIAAKGSAFKASDRVVVQPRLYCGACGYCRQGLTNLCSNAEIFGVMRKDGGMAEYLAVPERCLFRIGADVDFGEAAMVEPLAVAYRSVQQLQEDTVQGAQYTLLVGSGTIGLLILQMLRIRGIRNIIVTDLSDHRLRIAQELGADVTVNPAKEDALSRIKEITAGAMADIAIEAVGFQDAVSQALSALKNRGTIVWVGMAQRMIEVNMHQIVGAELNIRGSFIYSVDDFGASLKLIESREIQLSPIISLSEKLAAGPEVFERLKDNRGGSIVKAILYNE
jgi:2-desacetyl-2-hydroxyethyl bacteriochlorophyllide A dehydrogenase